MRYRGDPRRFSARNLVGLWLTWKSTITLNGTDVSGMTSLVAGGNDIGQATGANQPLFTGAPTYGGKRSIQFTAANVDRLVKATTDIAGTGPVTVVFAAQFTATGAYISDSAGVGSGVTIRSDTHTIQNLGGGGRTLQAAGTISTGAMHVLVSGQDAGEVNALWLIDSVPQTVTPGGTVGAAPGGAAALSIGAIGDGTLPCSMDWMGAAWYQGFLSQSEALRVTKYFAAEVGVAA